MCASVRESVCVCETCFYVRIRIFVCVYVCEHARAVKHTCLCLYVNVRERERERGKKERELSKSARRSIPGAWANIFANDLPSVEQSHQSSLYTERISRLYATSSQPVIQLWRK